MFVVWINVTGCGTLLVVQCYGIVDEAHMFLNSIS